MHGKPTAISQADISFDSSVERIEPGAVVAPKTSYILPTLANQSNVEIARLTAKFAADSNAAPFVVATVDSILGITAPPPTASAAMLTAREVAAKCISDQMLSDPNSCADGHSRLLIHDPRWTSPATCAEWDFQAQAKDCGSLKKFGNGIWLGKPKIVINSQGLAEFQFYYEGIVSGSPDSNVIKYEAEKLQRKLQRSGNIEPVSVEAIGPNSEALIAAIQDMWSLARTDFPPKGSGSPLGLYVSRMFHLLASVPLHRLCKGYGLGEHQLRTAVEYMKGVVSGSGKISNTLAHPDRRARDIVAISRATGFSEYDLPWVKLR